MQMTIRTKLIALAGGVAAAELPELSRMRRQDRALLAERVAQSLERALFFLIPSAINRRMDSSVCAS